MERIAIEVGAEQAGETLAAIVRAALSLPWSRAKALCSTGRVLVDGTRATDPALRVREGMRVEIAPTAPRQREGALAREDVLLDDGVVLVVNKAAGLLTVAYDDEDGRETLVARAALFLKHAHGRAGRRDPRVDVVQRLDKDTSGVIVFARSEDAKRSLKEQLRAHTVRRRYLAIVNGQPDEAPVTYETYLVQDRGDGYRGSWGTKPWHRGPPPPDAKRAVTHAKVKERLRDAALLECRLETGRQHQIRIHVSEAGHPIVGETVYARDASAPIAAPRPMLHAVELAFDHPRTGERVRFTVPPPPDFERTLARLAAC